MSQESSGGEAARRPAEGENVRWALRNTEDALRGLQFGAVTLHVQDGVVVQVERTERRRYQRRPAER
jgi:hypothetical protein